MIEVIVTLNGVEFELRVPGNVYDGELPDFSRAVDMALAAYKQQFPLDPIDSPTLVVTVERVHTDIAARDGVGVETDHPENQPVEDLSDEELEELTAPDDELEFVGGGDED